MIHLVRGQYIKFVTGFFQQFHHNYLGVQWKMNQINVWEESLISKRLRIATVHLGPQIVIRFWSCSWCGGSLEAASRYLKGSIVTLVMTGGRGKDVSGGDKGQGYK